MQNRGLVKASKSHSHSEKGNFADFMVGGCPSTIVHYSAPSLQGRPYRKRDLFSNKKHR